MKTEVVIMRCLLMGQLGIIGMLVSKGNRRNGKESLIQCDQTHIEHSHNTNFILGNLRLTVSYDIPMR
jgi:hypothetical protein